MYHDSLNASEFYDFIVLCITSVEIHPAAHAYKPLLRCRHALSRVQRTKLKSRSVQQHCDMVRMPEDGISLLMNTLHPDDTCGRWHYAEKKGWEYKATHFPHRVRRYNGYEKATGLSEGRHCRSFTVSASGSGIPPQNSGISAKTAQRAASCSGLPAV